MNWKTILIEALPYLIPLLLAVGGWGFKLLRDLIQSKIKNEKAKGILTRADQAIEKAVRFVGETMKAELEKAKARGSEGGEDVTPEEFKRAKQAAIDAAKSYLGKKGVVELVKVIGLSWDALDNWLGIGVEAQLNEIKQHAPPPKGADLKPDPKLHPPPEEVWPSEPAEEAEPGQA